VACASLKIFVAGLGISTETVGAGGGDSAVHVGGLVAHPALSSASAIAEAGHVSRRVCVCILGLFDDADQAAGFAGLLAQAFGLLSLKLGLSAAVAQADQVATVGVASNGQGNPQPGADLLGFCPASSRLTITKTGSAFAAVRALAPFLAAPWTHRSVLPAIFDFSRLRLL